jgi:hypothetical protein
VAQHGLRVVRADEHQVEAADLGREGRQLDLAGLGHGAGVERRDLAHVVVGGADEPRGLGGLGDVHAGAVDAVALEPGLVVGEVGADRADQHGGRAEHRHTERDVRADAAATHRQVVDQEAQGDAMQLLSHELLGEPPRKVHEVVGRDTSGDGDGHGMLPCLVDVNWSERKS